MASLSALIDDFTDSAIDVVLWPNMYGGCTEVGGRARVPAVAGVYAGYESAFTWTFDQVHAQVFPAAAGGTGCYTAVTLSSAGTAEGTDITMYLDQDTGLVRMMSRVAYWEDAHTTFTYNATTHAWWRLRRSSANLLFETAPDSSGAPGTWTVRRTMTAPAWLTSATDCALILESYRVTGTSGFAEFDNVNTTAAAGTTHSRALADTVGITDTAAQATTTSRGVTDTVGLTDSPAATATTSRAVTDTIGVTDSPSTAATTSRAVADTIGLSDATTAGYELTRTVTDSIGITDQTTTQVDAVISRTLADTIGVSDAVTRSGTSSRTVADIVGITDQPTRTHTAARALADGIGLADATTLEVATPPPTAGGLAAVLYLIDKATGGRTPLTGWTKLSLSPIDNAVGALVVTCASGAPGFSALHDGIVAAENRDVLVELRIFNADGRIRRYRGFLQQKEGDDLTRGASWAFTGAVVEQLLAETLVYPGSGPGYNDKKELQFSGVSPGTVLITAAQQSQGRGGLPGVTWDFTTTHDSNGAVWASTLTNLAFSPTTTVLALSQKLVELQTVDFVLTEDLVLRAFNSDTRGVDRSTGGTPLRFSEVANLIGRGSRRESSRTPDSGTAVLAKGKEGFYGQATDATALANRGRRVEVPVDAGDIATDSGVTAAAQAHMQIKKTGKASYEYNVAIGAGRPAPGFDFDTGDYAQALVGQKFARRKISQWVLEFERGEAPACTVALNDLIPDPLVKLARALAAIGNGGAVVGTSTATPGGESDTLAPAAPTGLVVTDGIAYQDEANGETYASLTLGWSPVNTNTDGSAADDIAGYRVRYAYLGLNQVGPPLTGAPDPALYWYDATPSTGTAGTSWTWGGVGAGVEVGVQVAAYDTNGNQGPWSTRLDVTTEVDNTAPPVPQAPVTGIWFRTMNITSAGLGSAGEEMPLDWLHDQVWISQSVTFAGLPSEATAPTVFDPAETGPQHVADIRAGTWNIPNLPTDVGWYAALRSQDRAGNLSALSTVVGPISAERLVPDDLINSIITAPKIADFAVSSVKIEDAAIIRAKIADLAVNNAKIEDLAVGKITSGTTNSVIVIGTGQFRTAPAGSTGARGEWDSSSFRFYNASNVNTVDLRGDGNALITGTIQSALSGMRWRMVPAGELHLYPSAGSNYSRLYNLGTGIAMRGPLDGNGRSGRINADSSGVGINFSSENDLSNLRAEVLVQDRYIQITSTNTRFMLDGRQSPVIGVRRVGFSESNSSGVEIASTLIEYKNFSGSPGFSAISHNAGWRAEGGYFLVVNAAQSSFMTARALSFETMSSETVKDDIAPLGEHFDPFAAVRGAPGIRYVYADDPTRTVRLGVVAEQLPPELQRLGPSPDGGQVIAVDIVSQLATLWEVVRGLLLNHGPHGEHLDAA